jgi:F-type H+-transporting ATPase subunit delta
MADARVQGYAQALFAVAQAEGVLDQVEDELFRFARTISNEIRLRDALIDLSLPTDHRAQMIAELLGPKALPHTVTMIGFVVQQGRARELTQIIDAFVQLAAGSRRRAIAEVRSAAPMDDEQRARLKEALERASGKEIELKVLVDPSVVGGFVARVGDLIFDASVRRKLAAAKERFGKG